MPDSPDTITVQASGSVLQAILAHKREEIAERKSAIPLADIKDELKTLYQAHDTSSVPDFPFEKALQNATPQQPKAILEIKPAAPSAGVLSAELNLNGILAAYNQYAACLSVLTDARYFQGSMALLKEVRSKTTLPILCKDFIIDVYQLLEARLAGADAILLIVKGLNDTGLASLHAEALKLGLTPVVEIQDETELARALHHAGIAPRILLINNRNLDTLAMEMRTTLNLAPQIPQDILTVSASGFATRGDIDTVSSVCPRFLIGSALMKTPVANLPETLEALLR